VTGAAALRRRGGFPVPGPRLRLGGVKLRTRITVAAALAVAVGIGAGVGFAFLALRAELLGNVDAQLTRQATAYQHFTVHPPQRRPTGAGAATGSADGTFERPRSFFGDVVTDMQTLHSDGTVGLPTGQTASLPVDAADLAVAAGKQPEAFRTIDLEGTAVRMVTAPLGDSTAIQIAYPLTTVDNQLDQIGLELLAAALVGICLSVGLGWWVTRTSLRPVAQLTRAAERIAETRDLAHRIEAGPDAGRDEIGRLAVTFNAMLDAVQEATDRQRQLVADASHELRTPLTSLRTNIEVLRLVDRLDPQDREALIVSVLAGIDELTGLVSDTMELARGEEPEGAVAAVRCDALLDRVVERARGHWPKIDFTVDLAPVTVTGVPERMQRAVGNLLDNAAKFSEPDGTVEVALRLAPASAGSGAAAAVVTVRDHGPGIPEADLPHVFDRFYRAAAMRDRPGSGLGLAIVAQVAESHGGTVAAANHPDGGAVLTLRLPAQ
jgi:two-component system, OmpR family, sensor histidine kinase MprB